MGWTVETLNETVEAEVDSLPEDMRARLARIAHLIEEKGLERVGEPHVKHIEGRVWEMRLKGRSGDFAGTVCDSGKLPRRHCEGFRQEDGQDTAARDRAGSDTREIGWMMEVW